MFTCRISQTNYLGVFTVAFGTAWACTHGDLLLRNCHSRSWCIALSRRRMIGGRRCRSLIPSPSIFNSSRCLVRSSLRIGVERGGMEFVLVVAGGLVSPGARRRSNSGGSFARCIAVLLQGGVEAFDQGFSGERFCQEASRSRLQGSRASVVDGESRDENEGHAVSLGAQMGLQIETAHRRHLNIGYHARGVVQVRRSQEFLGRTERMDDV